jgi:hypothetical protein
MEGLRWTEESALLTYLTLPGRRCDGLTDTYVARFSFVYYPDWPPSVTFVNPDTRAYDPAYWPKINNSERMALHPTYGGAPAGLICNSMFFEFYFWGGHARQPGREGPSYHGRHSGRTPHPPLAALLHWAKPVNPLCVTTRLWELTLDLMVPYAERGVEAGCFWYGARASHIDVALVVGISRQINRPRNFEIPSDALAEMIAALPSAGLVAVAQIHTHPGSNTKHSPWDDDLVVSRKLYSLVLPAYGRRPCPMNTVAVHEFSNDRWQRLKSDEAAHRILLVQSLVDARA